MKRILNDIAFIVLMVLLIFGSHLLLFAIVRLISGEIPVICNESDTFIFPP